ncbi:uncharacterized protein LOC143556336 [Bidens hawaiensis]|uniref:uncharacterized protein LOC143556336 n=1 Tax=Bidens hawaiensis TaxID=980011 RepID=UPI0040494F97
MKRYFQSEPSNIVSSSSSSKPLKINLDDLPWHPSERQPISSYHQSQKDEIRRAYLLRGPCQPTGHEYPLTNFSGKLRGFNEEWYTSEFGNWLEYSVKTDKVCQEKLAIMLVNAIVFTTKHTYQSIVEWLVFRGHDESEESLYRGNFIEFIKVFGEVSEEIGKVILVEVLKKIFGELDVDVFSILVDESRDISKIEQMSVVLRYVEKLGFVKERFIGLVHVMETTALSLKAAIDELFARHNLSIGRVRSQRYDGASNMSGEFNG